MSSQVSCKRSDYTILSVTTTPVDVKTLRVITERKHPDTKVTFFDDTLTQKIIVVLTNLGIYRLRFIVMNLYFPSYQ